MTPKYCASFEFPHNWSKCRVLLVLYSAAYSWKRKEFTAPELALLTGLSTASAYSLCTRLFRYDLVLQHGHVPDLRYRLSARGRRYVDDIIPAEVSDELVPILQCQVKKYLYLTKKPAK